MARQHREEVPERSFRRPAAYADASARSQHADQLAGGDLGPRREHATEGRQHHVEACVVEGKRLGVPFHPLDVHAGLRSERAPGLQQLRGEIDSDHTCACLGRPNRRVPRPAGHVEHVLTRLDADPTYDSRADVPERPGDGLVVTRRPHAAGASLQLGQLARRHRHSPHLEQERLSLGGPHGGLAVRCSRVGIGHAGSVPRGRPSEHR